MSWKRGGKKEERDLEYGDSHGQDAGGAHAWCELSVRVGRWVAAVLGESRQDDQGVGRGDGRVALQWWQASRVAHATLTIRSWIGTEKRLAWE